MSATPSIAMVVPSIALIVVIAAVIITGLFIVAAIAGAVSSRRTNDPDRYGRKVRSPGSLFFFIGTGAAVIFGLLFLVMVFWAADVKRSPQSEVLSDSIDRRVQTERQPVLTTAEVVPRTELIPARDMRLKLPADFPIDGNALIVRHDGNINGTIEEPEAGAGVREHFHRIDLNRDGLIDKSEADRIVALVRKVVAGPDSTDSAAVEEVAADASAKTEDAPGEAGAELDSSSSDAAVADVARLIGAALNPADAPANATASVSTAEERAALPGTTQEATASTTQEASPAYVIEVFDTKNLPAWTGESLNQITSGLRPTVQVVVKSELHSDVTTAEREAFERAAATLTDRVNENDSRFQGVSLPRRVITEVALNRICAERQMHEFAGRQEPMYRVFLQFEDSPSVREDLLSSHRATVVSHRVRGFAYAFGALALGLGGLSGFLRLLLGASGKKRLILVAGGTMALIAGLAAIMFVA